ncbi:MAG: hypothetical protein R3F20_05200 [Planctomycetota bacterium]
MRFLLVAALAVGLAADLASQSASATHYEFATLTSRGEHWLDLDDGALRAERAGPGGRRAEAHLRPDEVRWLTGTGGVLGDDDSFVLPGLADGGIPWSTLTTSEGRRAWVRVLRRAQVRVIQTVVEYGAPRQDTPSPSVLSAACLMDESRATVFGEPAPGIVEVEVQIEDPVTGLFERLGVLEAGRFVDRVDRGREPRRYRLVGRFGPERGAVPRELRARPEDHGVFEGEAMVRSIAPGSSIGLSFATGDLVQEGADLYFDVTPQANRYAAMRDWTGGRVVGTRDGAPLDPWHVDDDPWDFWIAPGQFFDVPIRGGGVARCRFFLEELFCRVSWVAHPSAPFPLAAPELDARFEGDRLIVRAGEPDVRIASLEARDLRSEIRWRRGLEPDEGQGVWSLTGLEPDACFALEAELTDARGLRLPRQVLRFDRRPEAITRGKLRLEPGGAGFHFASGRISSASSSDVALTRTAAAGGRLEGAARFATLNELQREFHELSVDAQRLNREKPGLEDLLLFSPRFTPFLAHEAVFDLSFASGSTLVLVTQDGGYALIRLRRMGPETDPQFVMDWVYNNARPVFSELEVPIGRNELLRIRRHEDG